MHTCQKYLFFLSGRPAIKQNIQPGKTKITIGATINGVITRSQCIMAEERPFSATWASISIHTKGKKEIGPTKKKDKKTAHI